MLESHSSRANFNDFRREKCFEILGFDIILDTNLKPWLLEINYMPAFTCGSPVDKKIKSGVITEAFLLANCSIECKNKFKRVQR